MRCVFCVILGYLKKYKPVNEMAATSTHEINRDIALWFCRDLQPFEMVNNFGFRCFFSKNVPQMQLPSAEIISTTALNDIYEAIQVAVKHKLQDMRSLCIMMYGWTDKYKAHPYIGVLITFINNWIFEVITLGCHVVPFLTSRAVSEHVTILFKKVYASKHFN